jgi:hypothetical protein
MRSIRAIICASCLAAVPLRAEFKALWPTEGSLGAVNGSSPARSTEDNLKSSGAEVQLRFDPVLGWTGSRWLILPSVSGDWNSANSILKVEDQRFEFVQQDDTRLELGTAFRRTPDQRFGLRLFGESFQAKQAANEELATGVYNYQDGGLSLDWRQKWSTHTPFRSTVGLTLTNRKYPNWQSLDPTAKHEKDQDIGKLYTDLEWAWDEHYSTLLGLSLQSANYTEGLTLDADGTTGSATKRKDTVLDLTVSVPMRFTRHGLNVGLEAQVWDSNLNIFDSQQGTYVADYNSFGLARAELGYSYDFKGPWWFLDSPQASLDLALEVRQYKDRHAKNTDGSYREQLERDFVRDVTLGFNSAVSEHWGCFLKINIESAASNNYDQTSALYNYAFNTTILGVNFLY